MQFAGLRQLLIITGWTSRKPCFWNFRKKLQIFNKNVKSCKYNGIRFPDDVYVKRLERCHAPIVCEHWPWNIIDAEDSQLLPLSTWSKEWPNMDVRLSVMSWWAMRLPANYSSPSDFAKRNRHITLVNFLEILFKC